MGGLNHLSDVGTLEIDTISLHTPAWTLTEQSVLRLWIPNAVRGSNVVIPGAAGARPYPRRRDQAVYTMELVICGEVDEDGEAHTTIYEGLQANIAALQAGLFEPPEEATRSAELTMPDSTVLEAEVQVGPLILGEKFLDLVRATFDLTVPAGVFTEAP